MTRTIKFNVSFLVDALGRMPEESQAQFFQKIAERYPPTTKTSQTILQTNARIGIAQAALETDSPEEAALKLIQSQEQFNRFLELFLQQNKAKNGEMPADETTLQN